MENNVVVLGDLANFSERHPLIQEHYSSLLQSATQTGITSDFPLFFYVVEENQVLGYLRSFPDELTSDGELVPWAWNGNLFTHPQFRGRGVAAQLVREQVKTLHEIGYVWGGVFSSPAALRLYERLSFSMVGVAQRYCLFRDISPFVEHHVRSGIATHALSALPNMLLRGLSHVAARAFSTQSRAEIAEVSTERFLAVLKDHDVSFPAKNFFSVSAEKMNMKLAVNPRNRVVLVKDRSTSAPLAYLIIRSRIISKRPIKERYRDIRMMSLLDFGLFDPEMALDGVIAASLVETFLRSDDQMLEAVTSWPALALALRRHAMRPLGGGMSFKYCAPAGTKLNDMVPPISSWQLTHFCGDAYSFE